MSMPTSNKLPAADSIRVPGIVSRGPKEGMHPVGISGGIQVKIPGGPVTVGLLPFFRKLFLKLTRPLPN